jgi:hypothetical protein
MASILTAHVLNGGIFECGSSAPPTTALMDSFPPQWKGAKISSGRIFSVTRARSATEARREEIHITGSLTAAASRAARLRARVIVLTHPSGRQRPGILLIGCFVRCVRAHVDKRGAAVDSRKRVREQRRTAGMIDRRHRPGEAFAAAQPGVGDAAIVRAAAGTRPAELIEDGPRAPRSATARARPTAARARIRW